MASTIKEHSERYFQVIVTHFKTIGMGLAAAFLCLLPFAPQATAAPYGAPTAVQAVSALVLPMAATGPSRTDCSAVTGNIAGCPITTRLQTRLHHPAAEENGNLVSRSQNPPRSISLSLLANDGNKAHVNTRWDYGAGAGYMITFVVKKQADGWLVDDSYCTGYPQTSIYNAPVGPCSQVGAPAGGTRATVNTASLNLRAGASAQSAIVAAYPRGSVVSVQFWSQSGNGWARVTTADGRQGWMFGAYLTIGKQP